MNIERRLITDAVNSVMSANLTQPVGDMEVPDGGGWQGEVGRSDFEPYVVVTPLNANTFEGPIDGPEDDVWFPYALTCFGASRKSCEAMADASRDAVMNLSKQVIVMSDHDRKVRRVAVQTYGQVQRSDTTRPAWFSQTDVVALSTTG